MKCNKKKFFDTPFALNEGYLFHPIRKPFFTDLSVVSSVTSSPSTAPKTRHSLCIFAICYVGKLTTATTCFPTISFSEYRLVVWAEVFLITKFPKSILSLYAGFLASLNTSALIIVPVLISIFEKSLQFINSLVCSIVVFLSQKYGKPFDKMVLFKPNDV